ncbi:MAG: sigma-54 dependent transcriptional regulator [Pseudomonadota bacterium]
MPDRGRILIVDDDPDILTAGRLLLRRHFAHVETLSHPDDIPPVLKRETFDAILLDMNFGPGESNGSLGMAWLEKIQMLDPNVVVIMITAHGSLNTAIEAMKLGASDFIIKPWQNEKVVATVSAAVDLHQTRMETENLRDVNRLLQASSSKTSTIIGESAQIRQVLSIVERVAPTDANILILGENGTGKELIAREIHRQSGRRDAVFMPVDMGSIPESLFESELFGHVQGAFTGADDKRTGRFQAASGGTLFLDEIGNLPLSQQAKLLRVLEQRRVTPVGSDRSAEVDVRLVSATNAPRTTLNDNSHFRSDLLFRLNTVEITLPPLRDRKDDILPIARHFLSEYAHKYAKPCTTFSDAAAAVLLDNDWPGNIRALRHAVERAVVLSGEDVIGPDDVQMEHFGPASVTEIPTIHNLDQLERSTIEKVLRQHGFNISKAAKELGLTRASLYRRMEKHGI